MKSCFGYVRVSTLKQGEGVSLEAQKDAILAYATRNTIAISRWFEEKETAAKAGRPVFGQMLKLLNKRVVDGVVLHRPDRAARNFADWAILNERSFAIGVVWEIVDSTWLSVGIIEGICAFTID